MKNKLATIWVLALSTSGATHAAVDRCNHPFEKKCREVIAKGDYQISQRAEAELEKALSESLPEILQGRKHLGEVYDAFLAANGWSFPPTTEEVGKKMMTAAITSRGGFISELPTLLSQLPEIGTCKTLVAETPETKTILSKLEKLAYARKTLSGTYNQYIAECSNASAQAAIAASPLLSNYCSKEAFDEFKYGVIDAFALEKSPLYDPQKTEDLNRKMRESLDLLRMALKSPKDRCVEAVIAIAGDVTSLNALFMDSVRMSKPVVRAVERRFFTETARLALTSLVEEQKVAVSALLRDEILPRAALTPSDASKLSDELKALPLNLNPPKKDSQFSLRDGISFPVLDAEQVSGNYALVIDAFADRKYQNFTNYNAYFFPGLKYGSLNISERMTVLPALWLQAAISTDGLRFVIGHELGHKIDPLVTSGIKGLKEAYKPLTDCLSAIGNIAKYQQGEAFADWLSAKINGKYYSNLPEIQSPGAGSAATPAPGIEEFLRDFCLEQSDLLGLDQTNTHPDIRLRRMYIFGRDPLMRKALGCPSVAYCTLQGLER